MAEEEDYYALLGLPAALQGGIEASAAAIRKAYYKQALACHPDKRPDDPTAAAEFQRLQKAYDILGDVNARKAYDELLSFKKKRLERESRQDAKRQKMMQDLKNREQAFEMQQKEKAAEERAAKRLQEELARIRAMRAQRGGSFNAFFVPKEANAAKEAKNKAHKSSTIGSIDKERMLKVTWQSLEGGYSAAQLKEIFQQFGAVEDVVIRPQTAKKRGVAMVVMGSKSEAIAATKCECGDLSNPLHVMHLLANSEENASTTASQSAPDANASLDTIIGAGYHAYEDSILKKMQKKAGQDRLKK